MSLEQQIARLAEAVEKNNELLAAGHGATVPASAPKGGSDSGQETQKAENTTDSKSEGEPEIIWYHNPDEKKVWSEEGPAKRRKGIVKVDETTAQRLVKKYEGESAEEAEQEEATDTANDLDDGFDLGGGEEDSGDAFDESEPMDNETFSGHWNDWTKAAIKHALENGAADQAAAQTEVKKFIVPVVKSFVGKDEQPKVASIPEESRARFLNKAHDFFNG